MISKWLRSCRELCRANRPSHIQELPEYQVPVQLLLLVVGNLKVVPEVRTRYLTLCPTMTHHLSRLEVSRIWRGILNLPSLVAIYSHLPKPPKSPGPIQLLTRTLYYFSFDNVPLIFSNRTVPSRCHSPSSSSAAQAPARVPTAMAVSLDMLRGPPAPPN